MRIVVAAAVAGALLVPQPASAAPGWKNVKSKAFKTTGALLQVAAVNKKTIFAVNENGRPFHWNGKKWTAKKSPMKFRPTGLVAIGARKAWAVGHSGITPVAMYWNGKKWKKAGYQRKFGPDIRSTAVLSAAKDGSVWSVAGLNSKNDGASAVRRWNGRAFVNVDVPGAAGASLTSVSVRNKNDVWLAGTTTANGTQVVATVLRLSGGQWKQVAPGSWGVIGQPHDIIEDIAAVGPTSLGGPGAERRRPAALERLEVVRGVHPADLALRPRTRRRERRLDDPLPRHGDQVALPPLGRQVAHLERLARQGHLHPRHRADPRHQAPSRSAVS